MPSLNRIRFYAARAAQQTSLRPGEGASAALLGMLVEEGVRAVLTDEPFRPTILIAAGLAGLAVGWVTRFAANAMNVKDELRRAQLQRLGAAHRRQLTKVLESLAPHGGATREAPRSTPHEDALDQSAVDAYCDDAAELWHSLIPAFEVHGFWGERSSRDGLRGVVQSAPWPDRADTVTLDRDPAGVMCEGALLDFARRVATRSGEAVFASTAEFVAFDKLRRRLARRFERWSGVTAVSPTTAAWLRAQLGWPYHANTLKLQWYLEVAVAEESQNADPKYQPFSVLRDALDAAPVTIHQDADGYESTAPLHSRSIEEIESESTPGGAH